MDTTFKLYPISASESETAVAMSSGYYHMMDDETIEQAFYDGSAKTFESFMRVVLQLGTHFFYVINEKNQIVAHCYLNGWQGKAAFLHFGILKPYRRQAMRIGEAAIDSLFSHEDYVECLLGLTPIDNPAACRYVQNLGFRVIARANRACYNAYTDTYEDGMATILNKPNV